MIGDYFTKPLQGKAFIFFQNIIMGYTSISEILDIICDNNIFAIKERVENHAKLKKVRKWKTKGIQ